MRDVEKKVYAIYSKEIGFASHAISLPSRRKQSDSQTLENKPCSTCALLGARYTKFKKLDPYLFPPFLVSIVLSALLRLLYLYNKQVVWPHCSHSFVKFFIKPHSQIKPLRCMALWLTILETKYWTYGGWLIWHST